MISDNLKSIRLKTGESQAIFANKFGLSQAVYSQYETGKRSVPDDLKQMLADMGINVHWLVTGNGAMYLGESPGIIAESKPAPYNSKPKDLAIIDKDEAAIPIPFIAQRLSAGPGQLWNDDTILDDVIAIPVKMIKRYKGHKLGAALVSGDSMDDTLSDGDAVIFAEKLLAGNGVYALAIDQEVFVKRLEFDPFEGTVRVISDNPKYEPKMLPSDTDRVQILGKIIGRIIIY